MAKASTPTTERDWEAEDDMRTLRRAQEIHDDTKRYGRAVRVGRKEIKALRAVVGRKTR